MKSSLALLTFIGVVLAFSSAAIDNIDVNILTPEGTYKSGNLVHCKEKVSFFKKKKYFHIIFLISFVRINIYVGYYID